jgi:RNA polymerase sigma-70 factor (ECF subfamily)
VTTEPEQPTDATIRQGLREGRWREAFEHLLALYQSKVFHLAFAMLRNETHAEDVTQDIFLKVWKGLPSYHGGASLSTWIYTISRNTCLTELKRGAARRSLSLNDPECEATVEALPALQSVDHEMGMEMDVNYLLERLPEKYRRVVTLFYLQDRSYEEVGALLGLPLGTVKTFLFRAKRELLKISRRKAALPG